MFKKNTIIFILFMFLYTTSHVSGQEAVNLPIGGDSQNTPVSPDGSFIYETLVKIPGLGTDNPENKRIVTISPDSLGQYLQVGFNYFIGIAIALAVVMIIYGGVLYATTEAVYGKSDARNTIMSAVQGLALALGSWLILYTINPDLLKFQLDIGELNLQGSTEGGRGAANQGLVVVQNGILNGGSATGDGSTLLNVSGQAATNMALARQIAQENGLNPTLFACQIGQESGFRHGVSSSANAQGIAQILPGTARGSCPGINVSTAEGSLRCGARIMSANQRSYSPDYARALAAYNGGGGAAAPTRQCASGYVYQCEVDRQGRAVPNGYGETREYVRRISNCAAANGARV